MRGTVSKKASALALAAAAALTLGGGIARAVHAAPATPFATDTDDKYKPAGKLVTGTSHKTVFSVAAGAIVVTCTKSVASGTTPTTGLGTFTIKPPTFSDGTGPCTDNLGGTDTTSTSGTWKIGSIDQANDETGSEPNTGDKLFVIVPKAGAVVHNSLGCTITVAPNAPFTVTGKYNDVSTFTVSISNLPIKVVGGAQCPTNATTSTFKGTYVFSPGVSDAS